MIWSDQYSNSHSAPLGKMTNYHHDSNHPSGYPGYRGHISYQMIDDSGGGSNIFRQTGINTGSGGGGGIKYTYEVTLFAADWPMLVLHDINNWGRRDRLSGALRIYEGGRVIRSRKLPPLKQLLLARERV